MRSLLFGPLDRLRAPAPAAARVDWLKHHTYAHRGLHGAGVVENSPTAFARAMAAGLGIECDVQRSADRRAMVFHDAQLDRLTGERGPVAARGVAQLSAIALAGSADCMPTLRDLLAQVAGQVPLLIEIKALEGRGNRHLCQAVRSDLEGYAGPVAVMSFEPAIVRWFAVKAPHVVRGLVVSAENARTLSGALQRHRALWQARPDFLAYDVRDLPSRFAAAQRRRGLPVLTWTVRSADLRERAAAHADAAIAEGPGIG
jgi:glycerophosphoryl diester phosphodiesterase